MCQKFGTFKKKRYLCIRKYNLIIHLELGATVIPHKIMKTINFTNVPDLEVIAEAGIILTCNENMDYIISDEDYNRLETEFPAAFDDSFVVEQGISTMEELAEYINESEDWPADVEDIIEENGWVSDCGSEFGVCHDASQKVVINDEGKAVCVTMHTVDDVELEKGGYGHDTLSWVLDGEYQDCTGEFYVDKAGMLHHTAIAANGDEVEITAKYL